VAARSQTRENVDSNCHAAGVQLAGVTVWGILVGNAVGFLATAKNPAVEFAQLQIAAPVAQTTVVTSVNRD
jgi:hypothetical protein